MSHDYDDTTYDHYTRNLSDKELDRLTIRAVNLANKALRLANEILMERPETARDDDVDGSRRLVAGEVLVMMRANPAALMVVSLGLDRSDVRRLGLVADAAMDAFVAKEAWRFGSGSGAEEWLWAHLDFRGDGVMLPDLP